MSSENSLKRLSVNEMKPCPVMNLWALSELNNLAFQPGNTVAECWVHQVLAVLLFDRSSLKTARNTFLKGLRRHPVDANLVLYGDLSRERVTNGEEKTEVSK